MQAVAARYDEHSLEELYFGVAAGHSGVAA
jgi:hypothetical protein